MDTVNGDSNTRARPAPFKDGNGEKRHLTEEEQKDMSSSIADIFKLEEQSVSAEDVDMDDDAEEVVDVEDRERRTERLKGALGKLVHLWWQDSIAINEAAEKLADGSRDRELPSELQKHVYYLRFIFTWSSGYCDVITHS